ncbi:MAG: indole-3-glycerol phosphate synthase TrpC [Desulfitobacteriaceae bacterium]
MDILENIVAAKKKRLAEAEAKSPLKELWQRVEAENPPQRVWPLSTECFHLIAEVKRASPSLGRIEWQHPLPEILTGYAEGGAGAVSVLTEEDFFQGSLSDFQQVRRLSPLPMLRKDFLWTEYQLVESRLNGADAILLIMALLVEKELSQLIKIANNLGLEALVECHDRIEVERAVAAGARFIGVNNRDLRTFAVSLETTLDLLPYVPKDCCVVSESGIRAPEDVLILAEAGVNAVLVGESCLRQAHPDQHVFSLVSAGNQAFRKRTL